MRYIALAIGIIIALLLPAIMGAAQAIYRAGLQQKAEEESKHIGYHQEHPYIDAQRVIWQHTKERLKYWLLVRDKNCKACCLRCRFYTECKESIEAEKERAKSEKRKDRPRKRRTRGAV